MTCSNLFGEDKAPRGFSNFKKITKKKGKGVYGLNPIMPPHP